MSQELTSLGISTKEGQSTAQIVKIICSTIHWLEMVNMLPLDIDFLESCTIPDFSLFLQTLSTKPPYMDILYQLQPFFQLQTNNTAL
jgi:hypothetical protein